MLVFAAVRFDGAFDFVTPDHAYYELGELLQAGLPPDANNPANPAFVKAVELANLASNMIERALEDGKLRAYINPPATQEFYSIPPEYWQCASGFVFGKIQRVCIGNIPQVPPALVDQPVVLRTGEWEQWFNALAVERPRPPHDEVVGWCKRWIGSGKGNGMDKAWEDFKVDPEHIGLSRDDAFRPAWREAKTR